MTLSKLGLTGQEIAEAIWLASQNDEAGIIDVSLQAVVDEQEAETKTNTNEHPPAQQDSDSNSELLPPPRSDKADIVPAPLEQTPSLALPPNYKYISVPDAPAISQVLLLARALRPLARQIAVGLPTLVDEAATVNCIAETGVWQPILKPASELWLDVALVFDTSPSMCLWQRFGADLHRLLTRYGEFRDIRTWFLDHHNGQVNLTTRKRKAKEPKGPEPRKPKELLTGDRRRLVVIVSDCVAPAWHNGQMRDLIAIWSAKLATVVFHVFPERLWARTALSHSITVEFQGKREGLPSDSLYPFPRSVWDQERLDASLKQSMVRLPVVTLEQTSLSGWAKVITGDRRARVLGIVWDAAPVQLQASNEEDATPSLNDQIDTFLLNAAPLSRQLAALLVSAPVITLPIVRQIKQASLKQANAVHMAEVFMSGLLKVSGKDTPTFENAERIAYELVDDEVRDRLRAGTQVADALTVYREVSDYIAKGLGKSVLDFWALLRKPSLGGGSEETSFLDAFASVSAKILRGLGSEFEAFADALASSPTSTQESISNWLSDFTQENLTYSVAEYLDFPAIEPLPFEVGELVDDEPFPPALKPDNFTTITFTAQPLSPQLEPFDFSIATLAHSSETNQWEVEHQPGNAHRFIERLPDAIQLEMVSIPGGSFLMGSPEDEPEHNADRESPQHEVTVQPFFMGRYPVTQAQWRAVATSLPQVERELKTDPARFKSDEHPVEHVSWDDAVEFCARLSAHTERPYRLPSEAEWEYACRAGTTTPFHFGNMITTEVANYNGRHTYADGPAGENRQSTTPVDHFRIANAFGLSDMHGNVREWCADHWHGNYRDAPNDGSAWIEGGNSSYRVMRGGSWGYSPGNCRSAYRLINPPGLRDYDIGFRVCCSPPRT